MANAAVGPMILSASSLVIDPAKGMEMASKDKGGKSEKKAPKKNLKEKRAQKKEKKGK